MACQNVQCCDVDDNLKLVTEHYIGILFCLTIWECQYRIIW
jgi:hypothetical protein